MSKNNISIEVIDDFEGTEIFDYKALEERVNFLSDSIRSSDLIPYEEIYHNPEEYLFDGVFEDNIEDIKSFNGVVVAMGRKVEKELKNNHIEHEFIFHPAARGTIRKIDNYKEHVKQQLASVASIGQST